ncbi:MAG: FAD-dependent oxidoreductase [Candidatus Nanohaloarchaea archaeon]|nr:FAD-dependent oxidoreductase [Candidatus Nanohaloarchaea archaeon]
MPRVGIIGGGITGLGLARDLAMRGLDVHLFERGSIGQETSSHTHGVLHSGARYAVKDPAAAKHCIQENRVLRDIAPHAVEDTGGLFLTVQGDSQSYRQEKLRACRECGIPVEEQDPSTVLDRHPYLTDDLKGAFAVPDAVFDPVKLMRSTAASAIDHGAAIHAATTVANINVAGSRATSVTARQDGEVHDVELDYVINAAGPWAGKVAALAGLDVPMRPTKGVMTVVDHGVDAVLNRCRPTDDGDIVLPSQDGAVIGTTSIEVDDPDDFPRDPDEERLMLQEGGAMVPEIEGATAERSYWGLRPLYSGAKETRDVTREFFLLDHADDGLERMCTVVGGKFTTHRYMAERTADRVCQTLGVDARCVTDENVLPVEDKLDDLFDGVSWPP